MKIKQETTYKGKTIKVGDRCRHGYLHILEVIAIVEWGSKNEWVLYGYHIANEPERRRYDRSWKDMKTDFILNPNGVEEDNDMKVCTARKWCEILKSKYNVPLV